MIVPRRFRPVHLLWILRAFANHWKLVVTVVALATLEVCLHARSFAIVRPATNLDAPFHLGCQDPVLNTSTRASAALVMLARNKELDDALHSIRNVQQQFNRHFGYPWVFLNDQEWTQEFKIKVQAALDETEGGAVAHFDTIPAEMWGFPKWLDHSKARRRMDKMKKQGIVYSGDESYHHMCRWNSGFFYDHPALKQYRWYWRVEPDTSVTCAVTYDPFVEMQRTNKKYGYTMALWELGETVPSLFRKLSEYKAQKQIVTGQLWTAMRMPSYIPWPFRKLLWWQMNRDNGGDLWNKCHFWSNFEIADMDFYRSPEYRDLFKFLDEDGGFFYERWGDASVHSLAAAMLLRPEQVHHFADIGYRHDDLQYCPTPPTEESIKLGKLVPSLAGQTPDTIRELKFGCRCNCDFKYKVIGSTCFNRIRSTVM